MKISKETWIIMSIGMADLITTILFIRHHGAQEANPLFRRYWEMGIAAFVAAKVALLVGPLTILEWARRRNPRFVSGALRGGIAAYLIMYGVGYVQLNHSRRPQDDVAKWPPPAVFTPRIPPHMVGGMTPFRKTPMGKPAFTPEGAVIY